MKTIILFSIPCLMFLTSCGQDMEKIGESSANQQKIKMAEAFVNAYFESLNNGKVYAFTSEMATQRMINLMSSEKQLSFHSLLLERRGVFQSIEYAETWRSKQDDEMDYIRFKADFDKTPKSPEIRVAIDGDNRIAGYWVKTWSDMLK